MNCVTLGEFPHSLRASPSSPAHGVHTVCSNGTARACTRPIENVDDGKQPPHIARILKQEYDALRRGVHIGWTNSKGKGPGRPVPVYVVALHFCVAGDAPGRTGETFTHGLCDLV